MRMSRLLLRTLREAPGDAEAVSHQLLVRAGYIRRLSSGVYTFLPLGLRTIERLKTVVRSEMDAAGAQELLLPELAPVELFEATGRLSTMEDILFRVEARGGKFVLGPTHEEVMTATVAAEVDSYRDLPKNVYQIATKFRDEPRPRYGLLRGREFLMKDAYSFDADEAGMKVTYQQMYDAYLRIFERCGLSATPVEADPGVIGGKISHEFMVPSAIGEDLFARCTSCGYAANTEVAEVGAGSSDSRSADEDLVEHHTPGRPGIDLVVEFFRDRTLTASQMLKCIALIAADGSVTVALVPGDREVRVPAGLRPLEDEDFKAHPDLVKGYIGPMGLQAKGVRVIADPLVESGGPWVTGANQDDHHVTGATLDRDFTVDAWIPLATVAAGDLCPRCGAPIELVRAVEAGHCFQNGLKYSTVIAGASFLDADGKEQPYWQGCYGIGISRLMAVVAEKHHDGGGLMWPAEVAPYAVHLLALGANRSAEVAEAADGLYNSLTAAGVDVLYDDRDASPGVKFADADLVGIPTQLIVGSKGLARSVVERKIRATGERDDVPLDGVVAALRR